MQSQTDQMPQDNNTPAAQEAATSPFNSSQKSPSPETPGKPPAADSALTTQPAGVKHTHSGLVVKTPLYLKDYCMFVKAKGQTKQDMT